MGIAVRSLQTGAALAAFVAALIWAGSASADTLRMYIDNQSSVALYFDNQTNVEGYPDTIDPGTVSSDIRSAGENKGDVGQITYTNNQEATRATCRVTLEFSWIFNKVSGNCDDKNFTIVKVGRCNLAESETCTGSNNCNCHFNFNTTN